MIENIFVQICDILECRIDNTLEDMETTALCDLPEEDATDINTFVEMTEKIVDSASKLLVQSSENVELAVFDIKEVLKF